MSSLGEIIREARKKKGLTTTEVAEMVGVSQGYISHLENNRKKNPSPENLAKLSKVLDIPLLELMGRAGYIKTLGEIVKELREEKGWTLEDLERETLNFEYNEPIHINKDTLLKIESGEHKNLSVYEIYLLSKAFDVPTWHFSNSDLQTPRADLVEFLGNSDKPDPIDFMDNILKMLSQRYVTSENIEEREDILSKVKEIEKNKKRYLEQLNKLSVSGKNVVNESTDSKPDLTDIIPIQSGVFDKTFFDIENLLYLSDEVNYNGTVLTPKQKELILKIIKDIVNKEEE